MQFIYYQSSFLVYLKSLRKGLAFSLQKVPSQAAMQGPEKTFGAENVKVLGTINLTVLLF